MSLFLHRGGVAAGYVGAAPAWGPGDWISSTTDGVAILPYPEYGEFYQERSGASATTVAAVDDPVGTFRDLLSGSNFISLLDERRPVRKGDHLLCAVDQYLERSGSLYANSTNVVVIMGVEIINNAGCFLAVSGSVGGGWTDGVGVAPSFTNFGTEEEYRVNRTLISPRTRDGFHDALAGAPRVITVTGLTFPATVSFIRTVAFAAGVLSGNLRLYGFFCGPTPGAATIAAAEDWLAGKMGISL